MEPPRGGGPAPAPQISGDQQLTSCLMTLLSNDNVLRGRAEAALRQFCRQPHCLLAFANQISGSPEPIARQTAGVIMRTRVRPFWPRIDHRPREHIKASLLQALTKERLPLVRQSIICVIGEIAVFELPKNSWQEIGRFLILTTNSQLDALRETGIVLFGILLETVPDQMRRNLQRIIPAFIKGLRDPNPTIRHATLKSTEFLLEALDEDVEFDALKPIIPDLFRVVSDILRREDFAELTTAFAVFDEIASISRSPALSGLMPGMVAFMIDVGMNQRLNPDVRNRACAFIGWSLEFSRHIIVDANLLPKCVELCCRLMLSDQRVRQPLGAPGGDSVFLPFDDGESEYPSPYKSGRTLLDAICLTVPSHLVFDDMVRRAYQWLAPETNPVRVRAALTVLGVVAEGCREKTVQRLADWVPIMVKAYTSPIRQIRLAGINGIINYSEYCVPEVFRYHAQVLPLLVRGLKDESFYVREKVCYAIDTFCHRLGPAEIGSVSETMLRSLFDNVRINQLQLQMRVICSIGALSSAMRLDFARYLDPTMNLMKTIISRTDDRTLLLRSSATECLGVIAKAVGPNLFTKYLEPVMQTIVQGFEHVDDSTLREYSFYALQNISLAMGDAFGQYLPVVVRYALKSAMAPIGQYVPQPKTGPSFLADEETLDTSNYQLTPSMDVLEEKAAAILSLGYFATHCRRFFGPFFEKTIGLLMQLVSGFHPDIKKRVIVALTAVVTAGVERPLPESVHPRVATMFSNLLLLYLKIMRTEDVKEVVDDALISLTGLLTDLGTFVFRCCPNVLPELCHAIFDLLTKKAPCFELDLKAPMPGPAESHPNPSGLPRLTLNAGGPPVPQGVAGPTSQRELRELVAVAPYVWGDHETTLDYACSAFEQIARVAKSRVLPGFRQLFPVLMNYARSPFSGDRVMALAAFGEVFEAIQGACAEFVVPALPFFISALQPNQPDQVLKRNAAYGLGIVCLRAPQVVVQTNAVGKISKLMHDCLGAATQRPCPFRRTVVDNFCGAMSRFLISFRRESSLPVAQMVSVLLANLPIMEDFMECEVVYGCILTMLAEGLPAITVHIPRVGQLFQKVIADARLPEAAKRQMEEALQKMKRQFGQ